MKSVIIVAEGATQIALTPENDWEKKVLEQIQEHQGPLTILSGSVYECQGGYFRAIDIGRERRGYDSLILRMDAPPKPTPENTLDVVGGTPRG